MKDALWQMTNGHCAYCGVKFADVSEMTVDHLVPRTRGGVRVKDNRYPACRPCNSRKRDRPLTYLRDAFQRAQHGRPHFSTEQIDYLHDHGFVFPEEQPFQFYWEQIGHKFPEAVDV